MATPHNGSSAMFSEVSSLHRSIFSDNVDVVLCFSHCGRQARRSWRSCWRSSRSRVGRTSLLRTEPPPPPTRAMFPSSDETPLQQQQQQQQQPHTTRHNQTTRRHHFSLKTKLVNAKRPVIVICVLRSESDLWFVRSAVCGQ